MVPAYACTVLPLSPAIKTGCCILPKWWWFSRQTQLQAADLLEAELWILEVEQVLEPSCPHKTCRILAAKAKQGLQAAENLRISAAQEMQAKGQDCTWDDD